MGARKGSEECHMRTGVRSDQTQPADASRSKTGTSQTRMAWASRVLRHQEMPAEEIREVLTTDDREMVRRYLELHRERLEEHLAEQQKTLASLERSLTEAMLERSYAHDAWSER
jgi:hypothetical protein